MVRRIVGRVHGRRCVRQVRDHEQRSGEGRTECSASAILQQQGTAGLQRWVPGSRLALHEEVWVIII